MTKYKVKSFTILEVTITMLISALVIGITYTSYSIIVKSYGSFNKKNNEMMALITLDHLLRRDFEQAETIFKDSVGITLDINKKLVRYEFNPAYVVRNAARIDTFKVSNHGLNTKFETIPIIELQVIEEQNRIDEVTFVLTYLKEEIPYHYYKVYCSENLIKRSADAVN